MPVFPGRTHSETPPTDIATTREPRRHRFEEGQRQTLFQKREHAQIDGRKQLGHFVVRSQPEDMLVQSQSATAALTRAS